LMPYMKLVAENWIMPVKKCVVNGKTGYKWGNTGKCYTGKGAKAKATRQGRAAYANGYKGKKK
jgi:hypothetical protein